jgi:hypothetical protein
MSTPTFTRLELKHDGRRHWVRVSHTEGTRMPVPWPPADPEHVLDVRIVRDLDRRPLRLQVLAVRPLESVETGESTAIRTGRGWATSVRHGGSAARPFELRGAGHE